MSNTILLLLTFFLLSSCTEKAETAGQNTMAEHQMEQPAKQLTKQLRHVVLFSFKETATAADIQKVAVAFAALPAKILAIKDFEWGLNNSPEELNKGFTHCFMVTFASEDGRAEYLPHPDHQAFVEVLKPHLEEVLVVDYWTK